MAEQLAWHVSCLGGLEFKSWLDHILHRIAIDLPPLRNNCHVALELCCLATMLWRWAVVHY